MDDLVPRVAAVPFSLTTGLADSRVEDAVFVQGTCAGDVTRECISDAECEGTGPCQGTIFGTVQPAVPLAGSPIASTGYETSNLSGLEFLGSSPFLDAFVFGDGTNRWRLVCQ